MACFEVSGLMEQRAKVEIEVTAAVPPLLTPKG
jgi:enamine deaminase RidA (YjgF/YER057c/UK114 family)